MRRALEALAKNSAREERMQTAPPEPAFAKDADADGRGAGRGDVERC